MLPLLPNEVAHVVVMLTEQLIVYSENKMSIASCNLGMKVRGGGGLGRYVCGRCIGWRLKPVLQYVGKVHD